MDNGTCESGKGQLGNAAVRFRIVLAILTNSNSREHPHAAHALNKLAFTFVPHEKGELDAAIYLFQESLPHDRKQPVHGHRDGVVAMRNKVSL